ncbi:MAG: hypothetical protein ABIV21_04230 [Pyrinomonadaceae bacterium]
MKYCPICSERYDEEIIKFCTKDGTPLIEEEQPNFTALPSESIEPPDDEIGEDTVIRRNPMKGQDDQFDHLVQPERIVIPTYEQQVRPRGNVAYYPPPPPPNNVKTIILTIIGTLIVLGFGAILFKMLQREPTNTNININPPNLNANLNSNLGFDSNFNFNTNANYSVGYNALANFNLNTNTRIPTSTPTARPSPSASPSPSPMPTTPQASPTPRNPANTRPSPSPTPRTGPRPPIMTSNRPPTNN